MLLYNRMTSIWKRNFPKRNTSKSKQELLTFGFLKNLHLGGGLGLGEPGRGLRRQAHVGKTLGLRAAG